MQSISFYQPHLDRVSRSFAFCIQQLNDPFRRQVSLAYLLCRSLDTIEDSIWVSSGLQQRQYSAFEEFLKNPPSMQAVRDWGNLFPDSVPVSEKQLIADERYFNTENDIRDTVLRMGYGMKHYSGLKLTNLKEVNQYCYFVAGIVGELLGRLFLAHRPDFKPGPEFMKNSFHFGLFLQKVNLLKDQLGDDQEGRYLVPNREVLFKSLVETARGSLRYLTALPVEEVGYRTFCAWSLFLGLASMPWIQKSYEEDSKIKISRELTKVLLEEVGKIAADNEALLRYGEECLALIPDVSMVKDDSWFYPISGNALNSKELRELGILN